MNEGQRAQEGATVSSSQREDARSTPGSPGCKALALPAVGHAAGSAAHREPRSVGMKSCPLRYGHSRGPGDGGGGGRLDSSGGTFFFGMTELFTQTSWGQVSCETEIWLQ